MVVVVCSLKTLKSVRVRGVCNRCRKKLLKTSKYRRRTGKYGKVDLLKSLSLSYSVKSGHGVRIDKKKYSIWDLKKQRTCTAVDGSLFV